MQNTTPFSGDPNPDLTQTIRDVVNEAHNTISWGDKDVQEDFDTADEYTELLESVLLALCEELELDPNELVEAMRLTPKRSAVLDREEKKSVKTMIAGNKTALKDKDRKKFNHANARYERIRAIRRGSTGAGSLPGANKKWAPGDERNARAETPSERHEIGAIEREHRTGRTKSTKRHPRRGE